MRRLPSELNRGASKGKLASSSGSKRTDKRVAPDSVFQAHNHPQQLSEAARMRPSEENAKLSTAIPAACIVRRSSQFMTFHKQTRPSSPTARCRPSGLNATHEMETVL